MIDRMYRSYMDGIVGSGFSYIPGYLSLGNKDRIVISILFHRTAGRASFRKISVIEGDKKFKTEKIRSKLRKKQLKRMINSNTLKLREMYLEPLNSYWWVCDNVVMSI